MFRRLMVTQCTMAKCPNVNLNFSSYKLINKVCEEKTEIRALECPRHIMDAHLEGEARSVSRKAAEPSAGKIAERHS
jgi:hypothetical protein